MTYSLVSLAVAMAVMRRWRIEDKPENDVSDSLQDCIDSCFRHNKFEENLIRMIMAKI